MGKKDAQAAAKALADLYMFAAIIALCEHSLFSSAAPGAESKIIRICNAESQKCLRRYDEALEKATRP